MKWIKASERLPDKDYSFGGDEFGSFPVRWEFEYRTILGIGYLNDQGVICNSNNCKPFQSDLEWFDSGSEPEGKPSNIVGTFEFYHEKQEERYTPNPNFGEPKGKEAVEFAEWANDNYWKIIGSNLWNKPMWESGEKLTTEQLYKIWKAEAK